MAGSRAQACVSWTAFTAMVVLASATEALAQGPREFIVQFQNGTPAAVRAAAAVNAGAAVRNIYRGVAAAAVRVPNDQALAALQSNPSVISIVPNRQIFAVQGVNVNAKPSRPGGGGGGGGSSQVTPAGVARVGAPTAAANGDGVGVAIVDTGVDLTHPDLAGTVDGFSAFGPSCRDDQGHGTHVAGIVGARDNSVDVVGVAPEAQLYCVKVLDQTGSGTDADVMAGLEWVLLNRDAVSPSIRVVNMSLGRTGTVDDNPPMRDLVQALDAAGVSVVVAAGNSPSADVSTQIPAAYPTVISVASPTALDGANQCRLLSHPIARDTASYFTTDGPGITVSAPGEDKEDVSRGCLITSVGILSTRLGGGTTRLSGTSMAAPHVAGIAARSYQQYPTATPEQVRSWIGDDSVLKGVAPLDSPTGSYTFDGVREGIAQVPAGE